MKDSNWVKDKNERLSSLETIIPSIALGTFVGTMEEYNDALSKGQITSGTLIAITKLK